MTLLLRRYLIIESTAFYCLMLCSWLASMIHRVSADRADHFQCPDTFRIPNPITLKGKRFFDTLTGAYFPIKGIAYFPRPNDGPLARSNSVDYFTDEYRDLWTQDIAYMKNLDINTVRIYAVDPSKNHDAFMCELQSAGIYAIIGLLADCENCAIGPEAAPSCYPPELKERGQWIMNEFAKYWNTLAFSAGNEVTLYATDIQIDLNAPCQKKFLRDMRSYMDTCDRVPSTILPRRIPVGMVNWDYARIFQTRYFTCQDSDPLEIPEWYGLNVYQHCDPAATSTNQLTGWIQLKDDFLALDLPLPVVISEYGCRAEFPTIGEFEAQRTWLQVDALYSPEYQEAFAGGVVFKYSAEKSSADASPEQVSWPFREFATYQFGVGYYSPIDCDHTNISCEYNPYPEFDLLANAYRRVDVSSIGGIDEYSPIFGQNPSCPGGISQISEFIWSVDDSPGLPCYAVPTEAPTGPPVPTVTPTSTPTVPLPVDGSIPSVNDPISTAYARNKMVAAILLLACFI